MALHLEYQSVLGGSFTELDLTAERIGNFVCKFSDSHPAVLEFDCVAAQHTFPLELRKYIRFWDDAATTPDGDPQDFGNPLFEGFVWEIDPAESNLLKYVAYDPSQMAGKEIPVMSTAWDAPVGLAPPDPGLGAVPRLIFNCVMENDADIAHQRAAWLTVGQMIQVVLDDAIYPLRWYQAAPGADVAYQTSDTALFDFIPQEKVVSTNESIRGFLDRLTQQYYPEYAFRWDPGTHYWRWYSRLNGSAVTLTLNDPAADNTVISMELHRSLDGRYPAVKYYGPETTELAIFSTLDGSLSITSPPTILETFTDIHGTGTVNAYTEFQITDATKRRGSSHLPSPIAVRASDYFFQTCYSPTFNMSWDGGATWQAVAIRDFDFYNGIIKIPDGYYPYFWADPPPQPGSSQHFFTPNAWQLIWAPYVEPLTLRRPETGYVGTSNTVAGQESELRIYDEMLAVGYNRVGQPVTTVSRLAAYAKLAEAKLVSVKDIIYTGGCVLDGLRYEFCRMGKNINLAAVDADGDTLTTGWESINAVISDVEYNFAEKTTSLTFSSEALGALGDNIDTLKSRLRIGWLERQRFISVRNTYRRETSVYKNTPGGYNVWSGLQYNDYDLFYDRNANTLEEGIR